MSQLPNELILCIIECLIPSDTPIAFDSKHPFTRTLISLTLVSKFTYQIASKLLFKYCLFIDSDKRLNSVVHARLLDFTGDVVTGQKWIEQPGSSSSIGLVLDIYTKDPTAISQIDELLSSIRGSLRRLFFSMSLDCYMPRYGEQSQALERTARTALKRLTNLEEFYNGCGDNMKDVVGPELWPAWPRLRRLGLRRVEITSAELVAGLQRCSNLTHLVIIHPLDIYGTEPHEVADPLLFLPSLKKLIIGSHWGSEGRWFAEKFKHKWFDRHTRSAEANANPDSEPICSYISKASVKNFQDEVQKWLDDVRGFHYEGEWYDDEDPEMINNAREDAYATCMEYEAIHGTLWNLGKQV